MRARYLRDLFLRLLAFGASVIFYLRRDELTVLLIDKAQDASWYHIVYMVLEKIFLIILSRLDNLLFIIVGAVLFMSIFITKIQISWPIQSLAFAIRSAKKLLFNFVFLNNKKSGTSEEQIIYHFGWRFLNNLYICIGAISGVFVTFLLLITVSLSSSIGVIKWLRMVHLIPMDEFRLPEIIALSFLVFYGLLLEGTLLYNELKNLYVTGRIRRKERWLY